MTANLVMLNSAANKGLVVLQPAQKKTQQPTVEQRDPGARQAPQVVAVQNQTNATLGFVASRAPVRPVQKEQLVVFAKTVTSATVA